MNKVVIIQTNVPICEECGAGLKFQKIVAEYKCPQCKSRYKVIDFGQTEREFVCEYQIQGAK